MLDTVRRPEHTGERRCWPCTFVNALVVAGVSLVVARRRRKTAALLAVVGAAAVWLRGYVVPYTPAFAPRLVAASPLPDEWFHGADDAPDEPHEPGTLGAHTDGETETGEDVLATLVDAGVVSVDEAGIALDPAFDERWHAEMSSLATRDTERLAEAVDAVVPGQSVEVVPGRDGDWIVLTPAASTIDTWLSRPVAVAEVAAVRALDGTVPDDVARQAASPLRAFLTDCPDCGTALRTSTTASCCGGHTTPLSKPKEVLACPACDTSLVVYEE